MLVGSEVAVLSELLKVPRLVPGDPVGHGKPVQSLSKGATVGLVVGPGGHGDRLIRDNFQGSRGLLLGQQANHVLEHPVGLGRDHKRLL